MSASNPNGFPSQLNKTPAPMTYVVDPWPLGVMPQIPTVELTQDRASLETKFEAIDEPYQRIQRLLNEQLSVPTAQRQASTATSTRLLQALGLVNNAVVACYDNVSYSKEGAPATSNVATCTNAVGSITVPQVPTDLIGSAAQFELDVVEKQFPLSVFGTKSLQTDGYGKWEAGFNEGLYWSPDHGAFAVTAPIYARYQQVSGTSPASSIVGYPTTSTASDGLAKFNRFERGAIYSSSSGVFETHGPMAAKYLALGGHNYHFGPGSLGHPKTDVMAMPYLPNTGFHQDFEGGTMYVNSAFVDNPIDGTPPVFTGIMDAYKREGYERGTIGFPVSDLMSAGGTNQFVQWFERGAIYVHGSSIHWVGPELQRIYFDGDETECRTHPQLGHAPAAGCYVGGPAGPGGFPSSDEIDVYAPNGVLVARRLYLANHSMLAGRAGTPGAATDGWFLDEWDRTGGDDSLVGYPLDHPRPSGGQVATAPGWYQVFDGGVVYALPANGRAYFVPQGFLGAYGSQQWESGCLGWPVGEQVTESRVAGVAFGPLLTVSATVQHFQHGFIRADKTISGSNNTSAPVKEPVPRFGIDPATKAYCQ